jgi:hypothetical protein
LGIRKRETRKVVIKAIRRLLFEMAGQQEIV